MQDKDFDRFIQQSLEGFPEPEYNPAHWDNLEDRLHNLNASQPQPSAGTGMAGSSMAKLGLAASAILVTALNVALFTKPELFKNATGTAEKTVVVIPQEAYLLPGENEPAAIVPSPDMVPGSMTSNANSNLASSDLANTTATDLTDATQTAPVASTGEQTGVNEAVAAKAASSAPAGAATPTNAKPATSKTNRKALGSTGTEVTGNQTAATLAWPAAATRPGMAPGGMSAGKSVVIADNCAGNTKPVVSLALAGNDTIRNGRIAMSTCQTLTARFFTADKDSDKVTVTSNIASVLPGAALLSDKADQPGLMLHWEAKPEMARQQPYEFTLWLTDNRCPNAEPRAIKYALSITPAYTIAIKGNTELERGQSTTLVATGAPAGATYLWRVGKNSVSANQTVQLQPGQTTTYYLQVNSPAGCQITDSVKVKVAAPETLATTGKAEIPNIFTPNNDGLNDHFEINLPEPGPYRLEVFDRWGKRVYENQNYTNKWNAQGLATGTYYYVVSTSSDKKTYKGWVEVMR